MMGLESWAHILKQATGLVDEVHLAQLLEHLPSSHLGAAIGATEIGDALCMSYFHDRTHGLERAVSELRSPLAAEGAGHAEDRQPVMRHHDCNFLGYQQLFARKHGHNVAAVSVHAKDHTIENFLSALNFGHGEDVNGHAICRPVRNWRSLGFFLDILFVGIPGLTDNTTLLDLLDGIVETNLVDFEPPLHVQGLLLHSRNDHVLAPSST